MYHPLKPLLEDEYWHKMHHYGLGFPNGSDKNFDRISQGGLGNGYGYAPVSNEYGHIVRKVGTQSNREYKIGMKPFSQFVDNKASGSLDNCYNMTHDAVGCTREHVNRVLELHQTHQNPNLRHPFHGSYTTGYHPQMSRY